jgi:hypothetical protein
MVCASGRRRGVRQVPVTAQPLREETRGSDIGPAGVPGPGQQRVDAPSN